MNRPLLAVTVCVAALACATPPAAAQDAAVEETPPVTWSGQVGAGWSLSGGNTQSGNASGALDIERTADMLDMHWKAGVNYGYTRFTTKNITTANNYFALYKLDVFLTRTKKPYWFIQPQYQSDEFQGFRSKYLLDTGLGYNWFGKKHPVLKTEAGYGVQHWILVRENDDGEDTQTTHNALARVLYKHKLRPWMTVGQDASLYVDLEDSRSYQAESTSRVTFNVTDTLKYQSALTVKYNNQPVLIEKVDVTGATVVDVNGAAILVPAKKTDILWTNTLVWTIF